MKKKTNKRSLGKEFRLVVESLLKGDSIYIKDTGVRVEILKLEHNKQYMSRRDYGLDKLKCDIKFIDTPTYKALTKCEQYLIQEEVRLLPNPSNPLAAKVSVYTRGHIKVVNLSNKPYNTAASKILFDKKK